MKTTPCFQTDRADPPVRWSSLLLGIAAAAALFSSGTVSAQSVLDTAYNPNIGDSSEGDVNTYVWSLSVVPGKKVLVGGHYGAIGIGNKAFYHGGLARLTDNGLAEDGRYFTAYPFQPSPTIFPTNDTADAFIWSTFVSREGNTSVVGNFNQIGGAGFSWFGLIENKLGSAAYYNFPPSLQWPPGEPGSFPNGGLLNPGGEPVFWGSWWKADGKEVMSLIRQSGDFGDLVTDESYDPDMLYAPEPESMPFITIVIRQPDGKLLVAGFFDTVQGQARSEMVRLNEDFSLDNSFTYAPAFIPTAILLQPDGKIIVAGGTVVRLNANGSLDPTFGLVDPLGTVNSMALRGDGKIVLGGYFTQVTDGVGPYVRNGLAMVSSTGLVDPNFNPDVEPRTIGGSMASFPWVDAVAIQEDGKILAAGNFAKVSNVARKRMARMTADVPAVSDLVVAADRTSITWTRGGSAPEFYDVVFQQSIDAGKTYTTLTRPTYNGTAWQLNGLNLPTTSKTQFRATGYMLSGNANVSTGLSEAFSRPIAAITDQPDSQTVAEGSMVNFNVVARSSLPITGYQWRRNGVNLVNGPNISGATTDTLTITAAMAADGGTYTVVVKTLAGNTTSAGAVLKVIVAPNIITEPVDIIVGKGKTATFSVVATGTTPIYTWTGNYPVRATGKTGPKLSWTNAELIHEGPYQVTVSNLAGNDVSVVANLNVVELATVAAPAHLMAGVGTAPVLSATVMSEVPPLAHQWFRNGIAVPGGNTANLTLTNIQLTQAGSYALRATNQAGNTTGAKGEVGVVDTTNVKTQVQKLGATAVFNAAASGNGLTYQWKFGMTNITHDGVKYFITLGGKRLTVKGLTLADHGVYAADVTGPGGMLTTADETLHVTTGPPVLVGPISFTENGMVGALFSKQINDDGNTQTKPASYSMSISPALGGLTISKTGLISGRPTKAGTFTVTVTSKNGNGTSNSVVGTLTVEAIPVNAVGKFVALVNREANLNTDLGGRLDLTTTAAGTYSGKVIMGSKSYSFTGGRLGINTDGDTNTMTIGNPANVIQVKRTGLTPLTLTFNLDLGNNTISGTISDGVNSADIDGWRNVWSTTTNPVTAGSFFLGRFNFTYTTPAEVSPDQNWPHGLGYGYAVVPASGAASVTGVLADNVGFSSSAFLGPQGQFLVFKTLYTNKGVVIGNHQIAASAAGTVSDYGQPAAVKWLRKNQAPTVSYSYPSGFDITLTVNGSRYDQTLIPSGANMIGSNVAAVDTQLDFSDGGLDVSNPDVQFTLSALNKATFPANPNKVVITFTKSTGVFTGSFSVTDDIDPGMPVVNVTRPGTFKGIILQTPTGTGTGNGFFNLRKLPVLPSTSIKTTQILSGPLQITDMP